MQSTANAYCANALCRIYVLWLNTMGPWRQTEIVWEAGKEIGETRSNAEARMSRRCKRQMGVVWREVRGIPSHWKEV